MALVQIRLRHDRSVDWAASTVLAPGEVGVETDTGRLKVGDGVRPWSGLSYADGPLAAAVAGQQPSTIGQQSVGSASVAARADHSHALPAEVSVSKLIASDSVATSGTLSAATVAATTFAGVTISHVEGLSDALAGRAESVHSHLITSLDGFPSTQGQEGRVLGYVSGALAWVDAVTGAVAPIEEGDGVSVVANDSGGYTVSLDSSVVRRLTVIPSDGSGAVELSGNVTISGGANVNIARSGNWLTISSTSGASGVAGVASINDVTGNVSIVSPAGGPVSVSESGSNISIDVAVPTASSSNPSALASLASPGTSDDFARADHVHALPSVNQLTITGPLDYSDYNLQHRSSYTEASLPAAAGVPGLIAETAGDPLFSTGSGWVTLSVDGHGHSIDEIAGLSQALGSIPSAGDYVATVNNFAPDSSGNVNISVAAGSVTWEAISSRPTNLSYFVNDGEGDEKGGFVTAAGAASVAPVQSINNQTGAVNLTAASLSDFRGTLFSGLEPGSGINITQNATTSASIVSVEDPGQADGDYSPPADPPEPGDGVPDSPANPADPPVTDVPSDPEDEFSDPVAERTVALAASWSGALAASSGTITAHSSGVSNPVYSWEQTSPGVVFWQPLQSDPRFVADGETLTIQQDYGLNGYVFRAVVRSADDPSDPGVVTGGIAIEIAGAVITQQPEELLSLIDGVRDPSVARKTRVVAENCRGQTRITWQVSRNPTAEEEVEFENGVRRGILYLNLKQLSETGPTVSSELSYLDLMDREIGDFVDFQSEQGLWQRRFFVRAAISDNVDPFTLEPRDGSKTIYSNEIEVTVARNLPAFTAHPTNTGISAGSATFSAITTFGAPYVWEWNYATDSAGNPQFGEFAPIPARHIASATITESDSEATYTLNLESLSASHNAVSVRLRVSSSIGQNRYSRAARITGQVPIAGEPPETNTGTNVILVGQEFSLEKTISADGLVTAYFESRPNDSSEWSVIKTEQVLDPSSETVTATGLTATLADDGRQYRFRIANLAGESATAPLTITVRAASSGTNGLQDETVEYGSAFSASLDGPLLTGATAQSHYATVVVQYMTKQADGTFTEAGGGYYIRPTNGSRTGYSGLSQFRAGAHSKYEITVTPIDRPVRVTLLVTPGGPDPLSDDASLNSTVWAEVGFPVSQAFSRAHTGSARLDLPEGTLYYRNGVGFVTNVSPSTLASWQSDSIGVTDFTSIVSGATSPSGFSQVASCIVEPLPPRPILFDVVQGNPATEQQIPVVSFMPEHYHFCGAADQDGNIVVCPKDYWYWDDPEVNATLFFVRSTNEGATFTTRQFISTSGAALGRISVRQVFRWAQKFWIAYQRPSDPRRDVRLMYSSDGGFSWTQFASFFPATTMMSVANGWMLASYALQDPSTRHLKYWQAGWRTANTGGGSFARECPEIQRDYYSTRSRSHDLMNIKFINGQYVSCSGAVSANPQNGWLRSGLATSTLAIDGQSSLGAWASYRVPATQVLPASQSSVSEVSTVPGLGSYAIRVRSIGGGVNPWVYEQCAPSQLQYAGQRLHGMTMSAVGGLTSYSGASAGYLPMALGPQVGRFMYGQIVDAASGQLHIAKLDAYNPANFRLLRTAADTYLLPGITYTTRPEVGRNLERPVSRKDYAPDKISRFLRIGGYVYGPTAENDEFFGSLGVDVSSQLPDKFLDGRDIPEYSDTIYTRNKVLMFYRSDLSQPQPDSRSPTRWGFERDTSDSRNFTLGYLPR